MLPTKSPQTLSFCSVRKLNILLFFPSVLAKSFSKENGITYTESCPSGRRCSTRNAVSRKASRVRIPNSPPKSPVTKRFSGLFFFVRFRKTASKPPQEQPDFWKELRTFCVFLAYSNRQARFFSSSYEFSLHLLPKFTVSGNAIPFTIALAEDSFDE